MSDDLSERPDPDITQDPGIPGFDVMSDPRDRPIPDEKDPSAEGREHPETDEEGHMSTGELLGS